MILAEGSSILIIYSKNQVLIPLIFSASFLFGGGVVYNLFLYSDLY